MMGILIILVVIDCTIVSIYERIFYALSLVEISIS